jgi:hypothetical protein
MGTTNSDKYPIDGTIIGLVPSTDLNSAGNVVSNTYALTQPYVNTDSELTFNLIPTVISKLHA